MLRICILFTHYKNIGLCDGASKQTPDPKYSTTPGPRTPVQKFLDPPLSLIQLLTSFVIVLSIKKYEIYLNNKIPVINISIQ